MSVCTMPYNGLVSHAFLPHADSLWICHNPHVDKVASEDEWTNDCPINTNQIQNDLLLQLYRLIFDCV